MIFITFLTLCWFQDAYAYLDPGTGSLLLQSTIAAIAGGLFIIKTYFQKIKNELSKVMKKIFQKHAPAEKNNAK
jgi:hypothetical protein